MPISEETKGDLAVLSGGPLWGLFPIITVLSYHFLKPLATLAYSTLFAAIFFAVMLSLRGKWHELKRKDAWADIIYITLFLGILFYAFVFTGLQYTSPGNASLIGLLEVFASYLLFNVWRREYFSFRYIVGSLLMVFGAGILFFPQASALNKGDIFIVLSTLIAPFGNLFQQRARKKVSSETILFSRSLFSSAVCLCDLETSSYSLAA